MKLLKNIIICLIVIATLAVAHVANDSKLSKSISTGMINYKNR